MFNHLAKSPNQHRWVACILLAILPLASACKTKPKNTSLAPPEPVYFSKNRKAEIGFPKYDGCSIIRAENGDLVALLPTDEGLLQSSSHDDGQTWTPPRRIFTHPGPAYPISIAGQLWGVVTFETAYLGGQMHFHAWLGEGWTEPTPIRDTNWGNFRNQTFAADSLGNLYCAWIDWREGNPDVYFSSSSDGGKTWRANVRIDDDQTGQEQGWPILLSTPKGVLHALWEDNRNPKTLFDIYCSTSQDGGRTWSPSVKVNDDTTHAFQISPSAVIDGKGTLYAAWRDYRDKGASGDLNANIYFARSEEGGRSWSPNFRLSHAQYGHNWAPSLALASNGQLHCTWISSEDNPNFDVFYSYSRDGGQSWAQPARANDDLEPVRHDHRWIGWLGPGPDGTGLIGWHDWRKGEEYVYLAELLSESISSRPERITQRKKTAFESGPVLSTKDDETLFHDDFAQGSSPKWEPQAGVWIVKDQTYIGYGAVETQSFVGSTDWDDYVFSGRFKLDPIDHKTAYLYLRVTQDGRGHQRYYRLNNFFRNGVRLEYFDGNSMRYLTDAPFPFQKDHWYAFRTVVQGSRLNHFIDDSLLIAADKLTHSTHGRVGVGASLTPTYFKDILVTAIK